MDKSTYGKNPPNSGRLQDQIVLTSGQMDTAFLEEV